MKWQRSLSKFLIVFFTSLFIWMNFFVYPALSFSTLDACMGKPSCASAFVSQSGARAKLISTSSSSLNNIVKFRKVDAVTGAVVETAQKTFPRWLIPLVGYAAGSYALNSLTLDQADNLRDKARKKFCAENIDYQFVCSARLIILNVGADLKEIEVKSSENKIVLSYLKYNPQTYNYVKPNQDFFPDSLSGFDSIEFDQDNLRTIYGTLDVDPEWEEIPENVRTTIINDYLEDEEIIQELESSTESQEIPLQTQTETEVIEISADVLTDGSTLKTTGSWTPVATDTSGSSGDDTGGSSTSGSDTGGEDNSGGNNTNSSETELPKSPSEFPTIPETITEIDPEEDTTSIVEPEINSIEPEVFTAPNFLVYAVEQFSQKFPFDIIGEIDGEAISADCPTYTFFNKDFELCPIRDFFAILKYPVIITFLVKTYHHI